MNNEEIYWNLCTNDPRHPLYNDLHDEYDIEYFKNGECYCDSCFNGKTKLALEILRLRELLDDSID
jgi:hypothetical protein